MIIVIKEKIIAITVMTVTAIRVIRVIRVIIMASVRLCAP